MTAPWSQPGSESPAAIVPRPANLQNATGLFDIGRVKRILIETDTPAVREVAFFLARELSARIGHFVRCLAVESNADYAGTIGLTTATKKIYLGDEGYDLDIQRELAFISAPHPTGLLHGCITLLQIVESDREGGFVAPAIRALDKPWLACRGLRIDATRERPPTPWLVRTLDIAAWLRFSAVHLSTGSYFHAFELEALAARCRERGLEFSAVPAPASDSAAHPFRLVRLTAGSDSRNDSLQADAIEFAEDALPTVDTLHALRPEHFALPEGRQLVGLEAWIAWIPGATPPLLERAYLTRLAAIAEVAWTGPFRHSFAEFRDRLRGAFAFFDRIGADYDVPPPAGLPDSIEIEDACALELVAPLPGAVVEYTLDGSDPANGATIARAPLFLREPCTVKLRTRLANGKTSVVVAIEVRRKPTRPDERL
jgi:N-acetyl-beta-hexosaminidase